MELDLENPLPKSIQSLFIVESDQSPSQNVNLNPDLIRELVSLISVYSCNFDYSVSYLAVDYLHRFLCTQRITKGNPWGVRLMAISCVSLALKMMPKTECSVSNIQLDGGFIFDAQTICRMEKLILGALKWRMRSITPFSFINFFVASFKFKDRPLVQALKARATEIILEAQNDVKMLEFRPSLISATALLCASHELFPLQFPCFKEAISTCEYVDKDKLCICYNKMQETAMEGYESVVDKEPMWMSRCRTPVNVLDLHDQSITTSLISSHNDDEDEREEEAITAAPETETKRRRIT